MVNKNAAARKPVQKILVCDDDEIFGDLLETLLVQEGFTVVTAISGSECLEKFADERPDLLLIDLDMPNINGFQVMETLSADRAAALPPIIVISGHQRKEEEELARKLGAADFIIKPFNCEHFVEEVKKVLDVAPKSDAVKQS